VVLSSVDCYLFIDVSRNLVPIFRVQTTLLEDGTDRLSHNIGNYQSTLCNIPEDLRSVLKKFRMGTE
jgi:hypothetical protein